MANKNIDNEKIEHLSKLSKLNVKKNKSKEYRSQIQEIINYVQQISVVNNSDNNTDMTNNCILRKDDVTSSLSQNDALLNRKKSSEEGYFTIKAVINK